MIDTSPDLDAPDDDPLSWLEDIEGERALAWVTARTQETIALLSGENLTAGQDALLGILDRPDRIPAVSRRGGLLYNFWQDADHPRGVWRRTTMAAFQAGEPDWEILLDLDALAKAEDRDWVWKTDSPLGRSDTTLPGTHDRVLLSLSRGGGDAAVIREYDIPTRSFVPGGFALPEAKAMAEWIDRDTVLLSAALGEQTATRAGYPRTVQLWRRGHDPVTAPVLFETSPRSLGVRGGVDRKNDRLVFFEHIDFIDTAIWFGRSDKSPLRLDVPTNARVAWDGDWLAVQPRRTWKVNGAIYPSGTVLGISLSAFFRDDRTFTVLFEPDERRAVQQFFWSAGRLVISALDDLRPSFTVHLPSQQRWRTARLPGLPEIGVASVIALDAQPEEADGSLLLSTHDPVTPPTLTLLGPGPEAPTVLRQAPRVFNADGLRVTRHEAISVDDERIPYVQVGPDDESGDAPVHMTGYGGFGISSLPTYRPDIGRLWLQEGGTSVVANIRGGGEFGARWHDAGRCAGKRLSHDDFAAVAQDLVRRGVTRPGRIAAEGASNGGLLVANMLTRYPERFGALLCKIPLLDMRRYTKLLAGASWIAEYGDPDRPEDWAFLRHISAYHVAAPGKPYPPILFTTTRRDDRVHPGHARKMAAKLQAMGYQALFHEAAAGGHGHGKNNAELTASVALGLTFLRQAIGWNSRPDRCLTYREKP